MQPDKDGDSTEKELVKRLLAGEEEAYRAFFFDYFPRLFRFALYRVGGDKDLAEDVVQVSLTRALDKMSSYRGEAALFTWMCTICRREASAVMKRSKGIQVPLMESEPAVRTALESMYENRSEPDSDYHQDELAHLISETLDSLPAAYGNALEWKYVEDMSVAQIGRRLGRGTKAAEALLYRAREAFRVGFDSITSGGIQSFLGDRS